MWCASAKSMDSCQQAAPLWAVRLSSGATITFLVLVLLLIAAAADLRCHVSQLQHLRKPREQQQHQVLRVSPAVVDRSGCASSWLSATMCCRQHQLHGAATGSGTMQRHHAAVLAKGLKRARQNKACGLGHVA